MKHMLIMRANAAAVEAYGEMNMEEVINAMGAYNESMITAGVLVGEDGLAPEPGYLVDFSGETPVVSDGPYGEVHELFNGFWIVQTATVEEALEWAKRAPLTPGNVLEVRRVTDESDFADFADNEYLQKQVEWREAEQAAARPEAD